MTVGAIALAFLPVARISAQTQPKPSKSPPSAGSKNPPSKPTNGKPSYEMAPKQPGVVKLKRAGQTTTIALKKDGAIVPSSLDALAQALKHKSGETHAVDPRFADLLVAVSDHFGGRVIEVMGGYRPPPGHSNHNVGRALDLRIEGVPLDAVRDYCQTLDHAGVALYTGGKFVHLDWRNRARQWTDDTPLTPTAKSSGGPKGSPHTPPPGPQHPDKAGGNPRPPVSK